MSQQDSYIEDQKLLLSERALARSSSRPSSLIEQEKQRSLEKQRQDLANLQKQQAQLVEEKRRREREWDGRERALQEREARLAQREEEVRRGQQDLERDREELQQKKGAYQHDLERLRAAQEQLERDAERLSQRRRDPDACQVTGSRARVTGVAGLAVSVPVTARQWLAAQRAFCVLSTRRKEVEARGLFLQNLFFFFWTKEAAEELSPFLLFSLAKG